MPEPGREIILLLTGDGEKSVIAEVPEGADSFRGPGDAPAGIRGRIYDRTRMIDPELGIPWFRRRAAKAET